MKKIECFIKNAKFLNKYFKIVPLLYGSLGLEYLINENLNSDDIDILIPRVFIEERWIEFKEILENDGYLLIDEHEHTFVKNGIYYSYAIIDELETFANIKQIDIESKIVNGVNFKILSLYQYLKVYEASSKDGYRMNVKEKKDNIKIELIRKYLNQK